MKKTVFPLFLCLALAAPFSACKKSEPASPPAPAAAPAKPAPRDAAAKAGPSTELKVKWPVGNRYTYRMDVAQNSDIKMAQMPQPMKQEVTMGMVNAMTVLKETDAGGHQVELEFLAQEMEMKMGDQVISFDSKGDSVNDAANPFAGPFRKMIGAKLKYLMGADGKVEKIEGFEDLLKKLTAGGPPEVMGMLKQMLNEDYFKQMADYGRGIPGKTVQVGESWPSQHEISAGPMGKMMLDMKFTFTGWEEREKHKCAALAIVGTVKSVPGKEAGPMGIMTIENGTISGTTWFDPELGATVEAAFDQKMALKITPAEQLGGGGPAGQSITSDMTQKITVKLADLSSTKK